jgi:hypothetical protein
MLAPNRARRLPRVKNVFLLIAVASTVYGQNQVPPMQAESSGKCSPNILSNQGRVQFVCNAEMDKATAAKVVALLNRILEQQQKKGDAEVNDKLDRILEFLRNEAKLHEPRQLPSDQLEAVEQLLSTHPTTFQIYYVLQDGEGYQLAKQISDVLVRSHWKPKEPVAGVMIPSEPSGPFYGMSLGYHGDKPAHPGDRVQMNPDSPEGTLTKVLMELFPDDFVVDPRPTTEPGIVYLTVFANPKSKPAAK